MTPNPTMPSEEEESNKIPVKSHYASHPEEYHYEQSRANKFYLGLIDLASGMVLGPARWFRETVVAPNQKDYAWYHERFPRVPDIDTCYMDDIVCREEANMQYIRDKKVDAKIVHLLRKRWVKQRRCVITRRILMGTSTILEHSFNEVHFIFSEFLTCIAQVPDI